MNDEWELVKSSQVVNMVCNTTTILKRDKHVIAVGAHSLRAGGVMALKLMGTTIPQ